MNGTKLVLSEHKEQFASIGVDLFRNEIDSSIWRIEQGEDGIDYVVRTNIVDELVQQGSNSNWKTVADRSNSGITLFYKDLPVKRFAGDVYKFNNNTINVFSKHLVDKMNTDRQAVKNMLKTLSTEKVNMLFNKFSELRD